MKRKISVIFLITAIFMSMTLTFSFADEVIEYRNPVYYYNLDFNNGVLPSAITSSNAQSQPWRSGVQTLDSGEGVLHVNS